MKKYPLANYHSSTPPNSEMSYFTPPDTPTTANPTHPVQYTDISSVSNRISHHNFENRHSPKKMDPSDSHDSVASHSEDRDSFLEDEYSFEFTFESESKVDKVVHQDSRIDKEIYSILKDINIYDIMPPTNQLIILDSCLTLSSAISALVSNSIASAPVWDNEKGIIYGLITPSNIFRVISREILNPLQRPFDLLKYPISQLFPVSIHPSLVTVCAQSNLMETCSRLLDHDLISVPVVDSSTHSICYMLDLKDILRVLYSKLVLLDEIPALLMSQISDFPALISPVVEEVAAPSLLTDLFKLNSSQPPTIPITSVDGQCLGAITDFDVLKLLTELPEEEFSSITLDDESKFNQLDKSQTCSQNTSLIEIISLLIAKNINWVIILDASGASIGMVGVSRILRHIVSPTSS